jgi:hypothetical protein
LGSDQCAGKFHWHGWLEGTGDRFGQQPVGGAKHLPAATGAGGSGKLPKPYKFYLSDCLFCMWLDLSWQHMGLSELLNEKR